tara:strand:- start:2797 stop:3177 length:381 start_codon:yes stop_codon:yes gene_type:complete
MLPSNCFSDAKLNPEFWITATVDLLFSQWVLQINHNKRQNHKRQLNECSFEITLLKTESHNQQEAGGRDKITEEEGSGKKNQHGGENTHSTKYDDGVLVHAPFAKHFQHFGFGTYHSPAMLETHVH